MPKNETTSRSAGGRRAHAADDAGALPDEYYEGAEAGTHRKRVCHGEHHRRNPAVNTAVPATAGGLPLAVVHITELWRYPVKSMAGERLTTASVGPTGIDHDRGWGVVDTVTGNVLTARREPALLMAAARVIDGELAIRTTDGQRLRDSADLSAWLGRPVTLEPAGDTGGTYENPADAETETDWMSWQGPGGAWHDSARTRVSIVSTATLAEMGTDADGAGDVRRFRKNVVVDGAHEDALVGARILIGTVHAVVTKQVSRCVMVTRPQPGLGRDVDVLRRINRERGGHLGIGTIVERPGEIRLGDRVELLDSTGRPG